MKDKEQFILTGQTGLQAVRKHSSEIKAIAGKDWKEVNGLWEINEK